MNNKIPKILIERAAELWARKLQTPIFDNGDNSAMGGLTHILATTNMQSAKDRTDNLEKQIADFKKILIYNITTLQDSDKHWIPWLDTDYNPCKHLADAAAEAGIPESLFSCKSSVSMREDHVSTSFGYGAEYVNHYPLSDGRWLITTLSGSDIKKVIEQIMKGNDMGFTVEKA